MFKSCRNLFNLSRKLGSVVTGLGLAGVLFAGQVSAAPRWSQSDIRHLACVVRELVNSGRQWTWEMVAIEFNRITNEERTARACQMKWCLLSRQDERYARIYNPRAVPSTSWTDGEEACLIAAVTEHGLRSFPAISRHLNELGFNRNSEAYAKRWYREILPNHPDLRDKYLLSRLDIPEFSGSGRPSDFTPEEDARLVGLVQLYRDQWGRIQWEPVARLLDAGKSAEQCRERYNGYLKAPPNATPFTTEENESLMRLVQEYGERNWVIIAGLLGNRRTVQQCKTVYRRLLQNRNHVPIPQITTASLLAAPITASGNQNIINATNTSNAATQSRQMLPLLPGPFPDININIFLNE